jgi:hypothetical protein
MKVIMCSIVVILLAAVYSHAEMYQWVDEDGVVTFKDTPPPSSIRYKVKNYTDPDTTSPPPSSYHPQKPKFGHATNIDDENNNQRQSKSAPISHGSITEAQEAILNTATDNASKPFASDFAMFFEMLYTKNLDPPEYEQTMMSSACMTLGAQRFPTMKSKIDRIISKYPISGVVLRYGEPVALPFIDLRKAGYKVLAGIGMSPSQLRVQCGGEVLPVKESELDSLVKDVRL